MSYKKPLWMCHYCYPGEDIRCVIKESIYSTTIMWEFKAQANLPMIFTFSPYSTTIMWEFIKSQSGLPVVFTFSPKLF